MVYILLILQVYEDETELSENLVEELESRYLESLKNPEEVKSWEEVKSKLFPQ